MSSYHTNDGNLHYDYRYGRDGTYNNPTPTTFPPIFRKKKVAIDRNDRRGKVCPSCGVTRSMSNKCDCNS